MKFKIMDQEPIYLAGVVHYGSLEKSGYSDGGNGKHLNFDFEHDEDFQKNVEELKQNAIKLKDQIKEEMKFHTDHFNNDYKEHRKQWKEASKETTENTKDVEPEEKQHQEEPFMNNFEGAIGKFGDFMESLGKHIEKNARSWEANLKDWSVNFEKNMEGFGEKMDTWGENFGKRMEEWGESFGEQWDHDFDESNKARAIRRYPIYRTYEDIYEKYILNHPDHIKRQTFYEVQIMDTSNENVTSMVMLGGRMSRLEGMRYPVATMAFEPYKWVAVKLTSEEYAKDWLGSLEKVEQLKGYVFEPYFILRHKQGIDQDEIRLFCPISEKIDER